MSQATFLVVLFLVGVAAYMWKEAIREIRNPEDNNHYEPDEDDL